MESDDKLSCATCDKRVSRKKFDKHKKKCGQQENAKVEATIISLINEESVGEHEFKVHCEFCKKLILEKEKKSHQSNCDAVNNHAALETENLVECSLCLKHLPLDRIPKHKKRCKGNNEKKIFSSTLISNENDYKFPIIDKIEDQSFISLKNKDNNLLKTPEIMHKVKICDHCGEEYAEKKFKKHARKCLANQENNKLNFSNNDSFSKKPSDEILQENLLEIKKNVSNSTIETKTNCLLCGSEILERKFAKHLKKCKERNEEILSNGNFEKSEIVKTKLKCKNCFKEILEKKFQKHLIKCMLESNISKNNQFDENKEETLYNGNVILNSTPDKIKLKCCNCGKEVSEKKFQKHLNKCQPEISTDVKEDPVFESQIKVPCEKCFKLVSEKKLDKHLKKCFSETDNINDVSEKKDEESNINKDKISSKCKYCEKDMQKQNLTRHYKICPKLFDKCGLCGQEMPRSFLLKHEESCARDENRSNQLEAEDNQLNSDLKKNKKQTQVNCSKCGKKMLKTSLRRHEKRCNFNNTTLDNFLNLKTSCNNCGEEMNKQSLSEHLKTCSQVENLKVGKPRVNCEECGKEMFKTSLSKHHKFCGKRKRNLEEDNDVEVDRKRHKGSESNLENEHSSEQFIKPKRIKCNVCFLKVKQSKMHDHKKVCQPKTENFIACSIEECTKSFKTNIDLTTHIYKVHRTYLQCPIRNCNEFLSNISILKGHLKSIHNEKTRGICDYCKSKKLKLILPYHFDNCPQNNDKFICKSSNCEEILLNPLEKIKKLCHLHSTGECRYCHKVIEAENLKRHKKSCKSKEDQELDKQICNKELYKCSFENCNSSFESARRLRVHLRRVHQPPVECPFKDCKKIIKPCNLQRHIYAVHDKIKVDCPYCEKQYMKVNMSKHEKICEKNPKNAPIM